MKIYPEILVTGFPNSGTSFLCNLVVALGKSPGKKRDLKKGDSHNRWGYYENMALRRITAQLMSFNKFYPFDKKTYQNFHLNLKTVNKYKNKIRELAQKDKIEVYKDNSIPLIYKVFDRHAKFICIRRSPFDSYISPKKAGNPLTIDFDNFCICYDEYHKFVKRMASDRQCLIVNYEDFFSSLDDMILKISQYIGVNLDEDEIKKYRKIFRPRTQKQNRGVISKFWQKINNLIKI